MARYRVEGGFPSVLINMSRIEHPRQLVGHRARVAPRKARRPWGGVVGAAWGWLVITVALSVIVRTAGDRWWVVTAALLFGPRWVFVIPLGILAVVSLVCCRRALWIVLATGVLFAIGFLNYNLPWGRLMGATEGKAVRLLTCNVHRHELSPSEFGLLLSDTSPDVVLMQEWSSRNDPAFGGRSQWNIRRDGEYCIATRYPIVSFAVVRFAGIDPEEMAVRYILQIEGRQVCVYNVHLTSPHRAFEDVMAGGAGAGEMVDRNSDERRFQSWSLRDGAVKSTAPVVLAGDFNTPPESSVYRTYWSGFDNAFTSCGVGLGHTYNTRRASMRIDHVLTGRGWACNRCWVGRDVGSAHRPLIAELVLTAKR